MFEETKALIEQTLKPSGFTWKDVTNIYPAQCFIGDNSRNGLLDSTRHHMPCIMKEGISLQVSIHASAVLEFDQLG